MKTRATPEGYLCFERRTGLNILFDELKPTEFSKGPAMVSFAITNTCNLRCPHCFVQKGASMLDLSRLKQWFQELDAIDCLGVGLGGGEPMLHPDFATICEFVHQQTGMACTITTNATLLSDELMETVSQDIDFCRISMDGWGETHQKLRGVSFDSLTSRLEKAAKAMSVGVNYLVNADTVHDLPRVVPLLESFGVLELLLLPEIGPDRKRSVTAGTMAELGEWIESYGGPMRIRASESACDSSFPAVFPPGDRLLDQYVHVDADGVLKSTSYASTGIPIGEGSFLCAFERLKKGEWS